MEDNSLITKLVIFTVNRDNLQVYLPKGRLPAERFGKGKTLDEVTEGIYKKSVGSLKKDSYLEQLYTFTKREKVYETAVVYYVLVPYSSLPENSKINLSDIIAISNNIADYEIIMYAVKRLRWKIEYTNVVYSLLPIEFTLGELQAVYEAILGKGLDKRNFRRKILSLGLLKTCGKKRRGIVARPAAVYEFRKREPEIVKVF